MRFGNKQQQPEEPPRPNTLIGVGSSVRGTLMVTGTLRIEGEFEGEANDAALMMLLADGEDWSTIHDTDDWQNAIDQSFADLV